MAEIETSGKIAESPKAANVGNAGLMANCNLPRLDVSPDVKKDALGFFAQFDRHSGGREMTDSDKAELIRSVGYDEKFRLVDENLVNKARCSLDEELRATRELIRTSKKPVVVLFTEPTCSHCKESINAFLDNNSEFRSNYNVAVVGYANDKFGTDQYGGGLRKVSEYLGAPPIDGKSPVPLPRLKGYPSVAVFARGADGVVYGTAPALWTSDKEQLNSWFNNPAMEKWSNEPGVKLDGRSKDFAIDLGKW